MSKFREHRFLGIICLFLATISLSLSVYALIDSNIFMDTQSGLKSNMSSPSNSISEDKILVYDEYVMINQSGLVWFTVLNTDSMLPFIDAGNHVLGKSITNESEIHIGDVITYTDSRGEYIMHRIININNDENGTYYTLQGDNNYYPDLDKVRFSQMSFKVVSVVY